MYGYVPKNTKAKHGSSSMYIYGCRCDLCITGLRERSKRAYYKKPYTPEQKIKKAIQRRASQKRQREQIRDLIAKVKDVPCTDCKNIFPDYVMDLDHLPERGPKLFTVSQAVHKLFNMQKLLDEVAKCEVVCSNCHRIRTNKRRMVDIQKSSSVDVL